MKRKIRKILEENKNGIYSHLIVYYDVDDYEYFLRNVSYEEDINEVIKDINECVCRVQAVYNYNLDLTMQLMEHNPYYIEPNIKNNRETNLSNRKEGNMTKEEIKKIVMSGNTGEYSHVIIVCDRFDYEDYPVFVKYGEDINKMISKYNNYQNMSKIMEIYNYNLDLNSQLNESRAYHIEPIFQKESKKDFQNYSKKVEEAIEFATKMHNGQLRKDGKQYIEHPLNVMKNVLKFKKSKNIEELLICACLHDTLEDTEATYYDIINKFGPLVASIVFELTNNEDLKKELGKEKYLQIKLKNMSSWALTIKLCDRLDNINDISKCDDKFKKHYITETINIIEYLISNRKINDTQIKIIEEIINKISIMCKDYNIILEKLDNIKNILKKEKSKLIFKKLVEYENNISNENYKSLILNL